MSTNMSMNMMSINKWWGWAQVVNKYINDEYKYEYEYDEYR